MNIIDYLVIMIVMLQIEYHEEGYIIYIKCLKTNSFKLTYL